MTRLSLLMSSFQPVSCAAKRTFCPRRPMASESCLSGTTTLAVFSSVLISTLVVAAGLRALPKTLTFEEILSQLEAIPERRGRPRYTDEKMGIGAETKPKKGKKAGPVEEELGTKPKIKKGTKRRVTIEDEDLIGDEDLGEDDLGGKEDLEEGE